jgi:hypothetical protein
VMPSGPIQLFDPAAQGGAGQAQGEQG